MRIVPEGGCSSEAECHPGDRPKTMVEVFWVSQAQIVEKIEAVSGREFVWLVSWFCCLRSGPREHG
jgi:hypothetical protein